MSCIKINEKEQLINRMVQIFEEAIGLRQVTIEDIEEAISRVKIKNFQKMMVYPIIDLKLKSE